MAILERQRTGVARPEPRRSLLRRAAIPVGVGLLVAVADAVGAGIPSYWGDEAASVMSGERSLPSLLQELSAVDAVHGLYYMLLHVWMGMFGSGEWATRALSVIGIGALAAGVVVLGTAWFDQRTAVVSGLLVAVIPRASALAIETRGYAITAAVAVWLTVLFTRLLLRRAERRSWVLFGAVAGVCAWFFLYLLLVPLALCAAVLIVPTAFARLGAASRRDVFAAGVSAVTAALPILVLAAIQRHQVAFLADRGYLSPRGVLVSPWFGHLAAVAVMWLLIVVGGVIALRRPVERASAVLASAWLLLPAVALILLALTVSPTYDPRYLAVSLGAVAMLAGRGITGILDLARGRRPSMRLLVAGVLAVTVLGVSVPQYLHQRTPYAKDGGADLRVAADVVGGGARPGDAVLFGQGHRPSREARLAFRLYPEDFAGLADPQLITPFDETSGLWDQLASVSEVAPHLGERTVWLLESADAHTRPADLSALQDAGYLLAAKEHVHRTTVYEFTEESRHA